MDHPSETLLPLCPPLDSSWRFRRQRLGTGIDCAFTFREGAGMPLLFLTANRTTRRIFDFVLAALDPRNPVAVPDYRGLGESSHAADGAHGLENHLDDIEALVDALGWERFAVIGQATGATLSLMLATRLPERVTAIAAGDAAVSLRADVFDLFLTQVEAHDRGFTTPAQALEATPFRQQWSDEVARHWIDTALMRCPDGLYRWRYHRPAIVQTQRELCDDLWPRIRVTQPTLLFHGEHCTVIDAAAMRTARGNIPHGSFARLAGANHRLSQDSPLEFARLVSAFLTEQHVLHR